MKGCLSGAGALLLLVGVSSVAWADTYEACVDRCYSAEETCIDQACAADAESGCEAVCVETSRRCEERCDAENPAPSMPDPDVPDDDDEGGYPE